MTLETKGHGDTPDPDLYFTKADLVGVVPHDNDPVVISVVLVGRKVHRSLIDQGSSTNVLFWSTFVNLRLSPDQLRPHDKCSIGFVGDQVECQGYIDLRTTFSDEEAARTIVIRYVVVNTPSDYNLLLGRPSLNRLWAVASTKHMKMKLPSLEGRVITIRSNQKDVQKCYESSLKCMRSYNAYTISQGGKVAEVLETELSHRPRLGPASEIQEREIEGKLFKLSASMGQELQDQIAGVIAKHLDVFAWNSADMLGIDPDFLCHKLTMDNRIRLVVQRRRKFNEERRLVIKTESQKLLNADHILRRFNTPSGWQT